MIDNGNYLQIKGSKVKSNRRIGIIFWLPSLLGVAIFYLVPMIALIRYALGSGTEAWRFVGPENFRRLFQNAAFRLGARNTAIFTLTAVPGCVVLSLGLALILEKAIYGRNLIRALLLSPMTVPAASAALVWNATFAYNGFLNGILTRLGTERVDWLDTPWAVGILGLLFCWKTAGCGMVLFSASLAAIPREQIEAALLDGAEGHTLFWRIKFPYLAPTISFVTLFTVMSSFKIFRETWLLAGDYPTESLYSMQHFFNNSFRNLDLTKLSTGAVAVSGVVLIMAGCLLWAERRLGKDVEE